MLTPYTVFYSIYTVQQKYKAKTNLCSNRVNRGAMSVFLSLLCSGLISALT